VAGRRRVKHDFPGHVYAEQVVGGKVVAGELVRLACERHLRDLAAQPARGWFDEDAARHAIEFFRFLKHSKGEWGGQPFRLEPWQQFIIGSVFGWMREDGTRRFRQVYCEVGKKNGKSTLAAGVGLYLFVADNEPGAEIYTAATVRNQAKIIFDEATRMVRKSPALRKRVLVLRNSMSIENTDSSYKPLGRDSDYIEGINVHGGIIDEIHVHKDRGVIDLLNNSLGARRQPLIFKITTAGFESNLIWVNERDHAEDVLKGTIDNEALFTYIAAIDPEDDWQDPRNWAKATPNLGVSVKLSDLQDGALTARQKPPELSAFLRLRLGRRRTDEETKAIPLPVWDASSGVIDAEKLRGRECYGGLDLSSSIDLTAFVLDFPPLEEDGPHIWLPYFFIPGDDLEERSRQMAMPFDAWERAGHIEVTAGSVIDYKVVRRRINELAKKFDIREIAYDRAYATQLSLELQEDDGFTVVPFGQGYLSMSSPTKELLRLLAQKRLWHGGHPVLRWNADSLVTIQDAAENLKPVKPDRRKTRKRIDGMVAGIMALDRAIRHESGRSVYEERGMRSLS
jgi:phage terminase large subunit-like protein